MVLAFVGFSSFAGVAGDVVEDAGFAWPLFAFALEEAPPPCEGDGLFFFPSSDGVTILTLQ